jgi:hypothetical protein
LAIAAAAVMLSAALAGCGGGKGNGPGGGANVTQSATPTPSTDPYGFTYVPYGDYAEAARQTGILPDVVKPEYGFHAGIAALCRRTPEDLTKLLDELRSASARKEAPGYALRGMVDEVSLRLGLACPRRMSDWIAAGGGGAEPTEEPDPTETPQPSASDEPTGSPDSGSSDSGSSDSGSSDSGGSGSGGSATPEATYSESNFGPARIDGLNTGDTGDSTDPGPEATATGDSSY